MYFAENILRKYYDKKTFDNLFVVRIMNFFGEILRGVADEGEFFLTTET